MQPHTVGLVRPVVATLLIPRQDDTRSFQNVGIRSHAQAETSSPSRVQGPSSEDEPVPVARSGAEDLEADRHLRRRLLLRAAETNPQNRRAYKVDRSFLRDT